MAKNLVFPERIFACSGKFKHPMDIFGYQSWQFQSDDIPTHGPVRGVPTITRSPSSFKFATSAAPSFLPIVSARSVDFTWGVWLLRWVNPKSS